MTDQPSSSDVQRDVHESRERVERTLSEIEERFSPGRLFDRAMDYMKDNSQELGMFGRNLGRTMRDHPVPVMLVMGGLAALAISGMRSDGGPRHRRYGRYDWPTDEDRMAYGDAAYDEDDYDYVSGVYAADSDAEESGNQEGMGEKLKHKAEDALGRAKSAGRRARARARSARYSMSHRYDEASQRVTYGYESQPLLFGAAASILGLSLAVMLPATRKEDELMGEQRDHLRDEAKQKIQEGVDVTRETLSAGGRENGLDGSPGGSAHAASYPASSI